MLQWFNDLINQGTEAARGAIYLLAVVSVGVVWWTRKAVVPVLGTLIVSGIVIWGVSKAGQDELRDKVQKDGKAGAENSMSVELPNPPVTLVTPVVNA